MKSITAASSLSYWRELYARWKPVTGCCLLCGGVALAEVALCTGCRGDIAAWQGERALLRRAGAIDELYVGYRYELPLDHLLARFKYRADMVAGSVLQELMRDAVGPLIPVTASVLLPVPMPWPRLIWRGFNQACELARALGRDARLPVVTGWVRQGLAGSQQRLSAARRLRRDRHRFRVTERVIRDAHVVIVDDVITTGATVNALALALKRAGCRRVDVAALLQTPPAT